MRKLSDLKILTYVLLDGGEQEDITLKIVKNYEGDRWAIRNGHDCFNKSTKEFDYEPMASSRNEEYYAAHRFSSPEEAVQCFDEEHERRKRLIKEVIAKQWSSSDFVRLAKFSPNGIIRTISDLVMQERKSGVNTIYVVILRDKK